jgi:hypothetical protein
MSQLIQRLREIERLKVGDPAPDWLCIANGWGPALSELCGDAADEIESLNVRVDALESEVGV